MGAISIISIIVLVLIVVSVFISLGWDGFSRSAADGFKMIIDKLQGKNNQVQINANITNMTDANNSTEVNN